MPLRLLYSEGRTMKNGYVLDLDRSQIAFFCGFVFGFPASSPEPQVIVFS